MSGSVVERRTVPETVFVVLRQERGRYRDAGSREDPSGPKVQAALRMLLERTCERVVGAAEIKGRPYTTLLYVSRAEPAIAYAETDRDGVPVDVPPLPPTSPGTAGYVNQVMTKCRYSDALTPDVRIPLSTAFVPPRFEVVGTDPSVTISWERLREHARTVIVGEPGLGKTSCLRRLALDLASHQRLSADTLPIFIQLRDFRIDDLTVDGIARLLAVGEVPDPAVEFKEPLHAGRLWLLIDGLDELPTANERRAFLVRLQELCRQAPRMRVTLTSRDSTYDGTLGDFTHLRLLPFDDARITQWTVFYLASHGATQPRYEFVDALHRDTELRDLVRNPLLLSLTATLYRKYPNELDDRTGLFGKYIETLVHDWDAARGVARWRDSKVTPRQIMTLLAQLSALLVAQQRTEFTFQDVQQVTDSLAGFREPPFVLLSACQGSGLVNDIGTDRWRFTHKSLEDYLAASHLVRRTNDLDDHFETYFRGRQNRRVWAMSCALASDAGDLLEAALTDHRSGGLTAAMMVAEAIGQEVSASRDIIDRCCRLIVATLEEQLHQMRPLEAARAASPPPRRDDRLVSWVGGGVTEPQAEPRIDARAELEATGELLVLVHRARSGIAGPSLRAYLASSRVPVVRQTARAVERDGWCESMITMSEGQHVLWLMVTRSTAADAELSAAASTTQGI